MLDGVARDRGLADIAADLAPLHPRNGTFPGEVLLRLAADALAWCGASRADPVPLEGMRERFLPGFSFRGREKAKLGYGLTRAQVGEGGEGKASRRGKATATTIPTRTEKDLDLSDVAFLLSLVPDPIEAARNLSSTDRRQLRAISALLDEHHEAWRPLGRERARLGQTALDIMLNPES